MSSAQFTGFLGSSLTLIGRFSQDGAICFDGAQLDRAAALTRYSHPTFATSMRSFPVDKVTVRRFHDVALIHVEKAYQLKDGRKGISRYTDIWQMRDGKWLCIAAHISVLRVPAL
jgi:hypothetical protein